MKPSPTVISLDKLTELVPYSRSQIARLEKAGVFPKRVRLGPKRIGWLASEIEDWIFERAEARNGKPE